MSVLKAPFPYYGGKSRIAPEVWRRFGDTANFVEPFLGSAAVLLARPDDHHWPRIETVNDADGHISNFWRALAADPDGVAYYADWPVSECVPAGTMIATPTGPVPVESIKEGMTVLGERNGVIVPTTVTATRQSLADDFYQVGELRLTGNHPVWTQDGGYMPAAHLVTGAIVARLNWPVCELDLIMLQSSYDKEDLDYLRPDRPTHGRDTLHRGICAPEGKVQRAFVKRGQGGQNASGLLDTVSGLSGGSTGLSSAGRSPRRKLARKRKVLDCVLSGTRAIDEYHRWGGRVARLHPDAGASPEVVANEERRQVRAGACCRNEGQTPHSRNAPKDFRGGASALCAGNAPKDFSSSKGTRYEQAPRAICGEAPRCTPDGRTSGKNRRQDHGAQAGSLHRDRASIRVHNGYGAILSGQRGFCLSSDPQRLPLQRLSSSPCVAVYNFQTQTGNYFADNILVHNCDLHARGDWLYYRPGVGEWVERLRADPDYYDIKSAGWWVWFASCWIGPLPTSGGHGNGVHAVGLRRPQLGGAGQHGQGINRVEYTPGDRRARLTTYLRALAARLERVRVCCGDWSRVCGPSVTHKHGLTAVFLDPPYSAAAGRDNQLYSVEDLNVAHAARAWALENGDNPLMRIALCGYDGEGHEELETHGWHAHAWKANGGYGSQGKGRGRANAGREVVWFSPACINPIDTLPLFRRNGHTPQVKL